jgi:hypothetical protein
MTAGDPPENIPEASDYAAPTGADRQARHFLVASPHLIAFLPLLLLWLGGIEALRMATVYGWPGRWSNLQSALNGEEELAGVAIAAIPMVVIFLVATVVSAATAARSSRQGPALITSCIAAVGTLTLLSAFSLLYLVVYG